MRILVVGGAGYIGSHMSKMLFLLGHEVVVYDNLSTGHKGSAIYGKLVVGCLSDVSTLEKLFKDFNFSAVIHFAASSLVGESVSNPAKYYRNNVANTLNLLDLMVKYSVNHFIFSSTAAIFGEPVYVPIDEVHPQKPINPYGCSKLMVERILLDYATAYGLDSVALRYFNACGSDPEGELGEIHEPESHLIPLILQAASGRRKSITLFGQDYPTEDGTCIRDYVHVEDLCSAHALALNYLIKNKAKGGLSFNLGNGAGFSVQQVIDTAKRVVAKDNASFIVELGERRVGDPAILVADATKAKEVLGWKPEFNDLDTIVRHAWRWEKRLVHLEREAYE